MRQRSVMTKEEQYINEHGGGGQPFRTPADYFETLTDRVMRRIDGAEQTGVTVPLRHSRMRRVVMWGAAASVAALVAVNLFNGKPVVKETGTTPLAQQTTVSDEIDALADYTMTDDDDLLAMMTE